MGQTLDFSVVHDAMPQPLWGCLGTMGLALAGMALAMVIDVGNVMACASRLCSARLESRFAAVAR